MKPGDVDLADPENPAEGTGAKTDIGKRVTLTSAALAVGNAAPGPQKSVPSGQVT